MVTLEQIKLLESKVAKAIDIVSRVTEENTYLKGKLETYQKRITELEVLIERFKEEQAQIEEGVISTLERLTKFEENIENTIKSPPREVSAKDGGVSVEPPPRGPAVEPVKKPTPRVETEPAVVPEEDPVIVATYIPAEEDIDDALIFEEGEDAGIDAEDPTAEDGAELDIF
jgi:hypothetical protein